MLAQNLCKKGYKYKQIANFIAQKRMSSQGEKEQERERGEKQNKKSNARQQR